MRVAPCENIFVQIECIAVACDGGRPFAVMLFDIHFKSMALEKLDLTFVTFGGLQSLKRAEVPAFARLWIASAGV